MTDSGDHIPDYLYYISDNLYYIPATLYDRPAPAIARPADPTRGNEQYPPEEMNSGWDPYPLGEMDPTRGNEQELDRLQ